MSADIYPQVSTYMKFRTLIVWAMEFCNFSKQTTHFQGHTLSWILASTNVHHVTRY